jgi:catechol 2,3-dioxygenase-like lactoylglutathione lyase family enzyme
VILHVDFAVRDIERSLAFYTQKLAFRVADDGIVCGALARFLSEGASDRVRLVLLRCAPVGSQLELVHFEPPTGTSLPAIHPGSMTMMVKDLDAEIARLRASGVDPISETYDVELPSTGKTRICFFQDPDGHRIELLELVRP